jgi:RNA polymerase sigma factor (sigma-70 family)
MPSNGSNSVSAWMNAAGRWPLLTPAQEIQLATAVRAWQDDPAGPDGAPPKVKRAGMRARERLVQCNLRWVAKIAKGYTTRGAEKGLEYLDLLQEGALGLQRAAEKFDHRRGYKFSTYAAPWIKQGCTKAIYCGGLVRVPQHAQERKASPAVIELRERVRGLASLDQVLRDGDGSLGELIAQPESDDELFIRRREGLALALADCLAGAGIDADVAAGLMLKGEGHNSSAIGDAWGCSRSAAQWRLSDAMRRIASTPGLRAVAGEALAG